MDLMDMMDKHSIHTVHLVHEVHTVHLCTENAGQGLQKRERTQIDERAWRRNAAGKIDHNHDLMHAADVDIDGQWQ